MTCLHPKKIHTYSPTEGGIWVPCGKCNPCRIRRAREWAIRAEHELGFWSHACFVRLSYDDEHLPADLGANRRELQLFFKRLRKRLGTPIAYLACGEYGETNERPHFHALIFGYGKHFEEDQEQPTLSAEWGLHPHTPQDLARRRRGKPKYRWNGTCWDVIRGPLLDAWSTPRNDPRPPGALGYVTLGTATSQSARYIAGYTLKSNVGKLTGYHHDGRPAAFLLCSKGLGKRWCLKHADQLRRDLQLRWHGGPVSLPRYYAKTLQIPTELLYAKKQTYEQEIIKQYDKRNIPKDHIFLWLAEESRQKSKTQDKRRSLTHGN